MNPYSVVRSDALSDPELQKSPAVYMTLAAISTFTTRSKDGYCYFKQETIAKNLGKSRQAISRDLKKLEALGYIEVIPQNYRGFKSNNAYRIKYEGALNNDATSRCNDATSRCITTQRHVAAKCSSINANNIYIALTRDEFFREVDEGYQANAFNDFEHLTETEIKSAAQSCWDFMVTELKEPNHGSACSHVRRWVREGIRRGKIRKPEKAKTATNALQGVKDDDFENPLQPWHERIRPQVGDGAYFSYIRKLHHDGNGLLQAPNAFIADYVRKNFHQEINAVLKGVEITHTQQKTKEVEHA